MKKMTYQISNLKKPGLRILLGLGITLWTFFIVFPYLWMFLTSIKTPAELYTSPVKYLPSDPTIEGYSLLIKTTRFPRYLLNSIIVTGSTVGLTAVIAITAAYCFSRFRFPGKRRLMELLLISQMFPAVLLVLSLFFIMKHLNLLNTPMALILADSTFALPFTIWLLSGFLNAIPKEFDEAATIDGANRRQTFWYVILPLAAPGIVAALTYVFIFSWNEFIYALTFTSDASTRTLPVGLHTFMGEYIIRWDLLTAGGVLTGIPIIIFFLLAQKYLVQGLTAGAIKG